MLVSFHTGHITQPVLDYDDWKTINLRAWKSLRFVLCRRTKSVNKWREAIQEATFQRVHKELIITSRWEKFSTL